MVLLMHAACPVADCLKLLIFFLPEEELDGSRDFTNHVSWELLIYGLQISLKTHKKKRVYILSHSLYARNY